MLRQLVAFAGWLIVAGLVSYTLALSIYSLGIVVP